MTVEEKMDMLRNYCENVVDCDNCKLKRKWVNDCFTHCIEIEYATDEELDEGLKIISDNVNHPNHYQGKNECIDVMIAMFGVEAVKHFCMCNAYKYRFRSTMKNGEEDIKKAEWYETKLIELGGI